MKKGIIARKVGMTQIFDENGKIIPVTVLEAGPCPIVQKKTDEVDGYEAVQVGFVDITSKHVNQAKEGHFKKADVAPKRHLREFRFETSVLDTLNIGDLIKADTFEAGERVDVSGVSKGKGFQGVVKRHNYKKQPASHGAHKVHRAPGSLGSSATPSKVAKGKKLPGHMGNENVTVQNLEIAKIDSENNLIALKGAVPGPKGGIVIITDSVIA